MDTACSPMIKKASYDRCEEVMPHRRPEIPNHNERQLLQQLEGPGWVKAAKIHSTRGFIEKLLTKGWIEKSVIDGRLCYRITDQGLAAKKVPI
jgi:hypothetical protein